MANETEAAKPVMNSDWLAVAASWLFCLVLALSVSPIAKDLIAEQMVGRAVMDGLGPYVPLSELHQIYGGPVDWGFASPRTPGALFFVIPLAPIRTATLVLVMTGVNVTAMFAAALLSARMAGRSWKMTALLFPLLMTSEPGGQIVQHANLSTLLALGVIWTWWLVRRGDSWIAGLPLGMAAAARVFPIILAFVLLVGGRRRAGILALLVAVILNLTGLLIPGVSVAGSLEVLAGADQFFAHSNSLSVAGVAVRYGLPFPIGILVSLLLPVLLIVWVLTRRLQWEGGMLLGAPLMLLANPTSWPHYMANAGPSVARLHWRLIAVVVTLWYIPVLGAPLGLSLMTSLIVVVFGLTRRARVAVGKPPVPETRLRQEAQ